MPVRWAFCRFRGLGPGPGEVGGEAASVEEDRGDEGFGADQDQIGRLRRAGKGVVIVPPLVSASASLAIVERSSPRMHATTRVGPLTRTFSGADDEIRTRDPHLGKELLDGGS